MCPKCGGYHFELVTLRSVLQDVSVGSNGQGHWGDPVTLAIVEIVEIRCATCGVDLSHNEAVRKLMAERIP